MFFYNCKWLNLKNWFGQTSLIIQDCQIVPNGDNSGWGNNELQFYTSKRINNAQVSKGLLIINAVKESYQGAAYTSARLLSKGQGNWKYGRIEVRAKIPTGRGIWPAIWMIATDQAYGGWPKSGEIDIMENVGYNPQLRICDRAHGVL